MHGPRPARRQCGYQLGVGCVTGNTRQPRYAPSLCLNSLAEARHIETESPASNNTSALARRHLIAVLPTSISNQSICSVILPLQSQASLPPRHHRLPCFRIDQERAMLINTRNFASYSGDPSTSTAGHAKNPAYATAQASRPSRRPNVRES